MHSNPLFPKPGESRDEEKIVSNENLYDVTDHRAKYAAKFIQERERMIEKKIISVQNTSYPNPRKNDKPYDTSFYYSEKEGSYWTCK